MQDSEMRDEVDIEDVMRVLVATDNHLGYHEQDPVRGDDSFVAFEEILQMAVNEDVDFILLGGDLFHDAVPSQNALHKCMSLLRRYTFGARPIAVEYLNEAGDTFHNSVNDTVNYEDPNINISIPVFSIHGNHDDPSGYGRLSSLDLLSTTGLVNYFGRWKDLSQVDIKPVLLRKGATQLALYGLSHIPDSRLARLYDSHKVHMEPVMDDCFNLMVVHQNRSNRGPKNYLPEEMLPDFLNLVIWGHEHDCRIEPEPNSKGFYVSQPGSSVPTSLSEGEAIKKHVGLLEIYKKKFLMTPLPLQTVRPFIFESVTISDIADDLRLDKGDVANKVRDMAQTRVEAMLERAVERLTEHPLQPKLPQIRLRLLYSDEEQMFNTLRFGQSFNGRVANPADMVVLKKMRKFSNLKKEGDSAFDRQGMQSAFEKMEIDTSARVEDMLEQYFEDVKHTKPQILPPKMMSEMFYQLVERRDGNAVENMLRNYKKRALEHLMETLPTDEDCNMQLTILRERITPEEISKMAVGVTTVKAQANSVAKATAKPTITASRVRIKKPAEDAIKLSSDDDNDRTSTSARDGRASARSGRGRGRGAIAAAPISSRSRASTTQNKTARKATMQPLDVSINSTRSTRQQTLFAAIGGAGGQRQAAASRKRVITITSDSDSD